VKVMWHRSALNSKCTPFNNWLFSPNNGDFFSPLDCGNSEESINFESISVNNSILRLLNGDSLIRPATETLTLSPERSVMIMANSVCDTFQITFPTPLAEWRQIENNVPFAYESEERQAVVCTVAHAEFRSDIWFSVLSDLIWSLRSCECDFFKVGLTTWWMLSWQDQGNQYSFSPVRSIVHINWEWFSEVRLSKTLCVLAASFGQQSGIDLPKKMPIACESIWMMTQSQPSVLPTSSISADLFNSHALSNLHRNLREVSSETRTNRWPPGSLNSMHFKDSYQPNCRRGCDSCLFQSCPKQLRRTQACRASSLNCDGIMNLNWARDL
jgi:hypothetical protein